MRSAIAILLILVAGGCSAPGAGAPADASLGAVEVRVRAEPKQGAPTGDAAYGGGPKVGQFMPVDYDALDEIVVWVEPASPSGALRSQPTDVATMQPSRSLRMVASPIACSNSSLLLRDENGSVIDSTKLESVRGYVEVVRDRDGQSIARLFVVPTANSAVTRAGERQRFEMPAGDYAVRCWHPRLPGSSQRVHVTAGQVVQATATVGVDQLQDQNK